jgi:folylpolyglutamate synthase
METWKQIHPATEILVQSTIESALDAARRIGESGDGGMQTLITGSQHLVGPALALIRPPPAEEVV